MPGRRRSATIPLVSLNRRNQILPKSGRQLCESIFARTLVIQIPVIEQILHRNRIHVLRHVFRVGVPVQVTEQEREDILLAAEIPLIPIEYLREQDLVFLGHKNDFGAIHKAPRGPLKLLVNRSGLVEANRCA